MAAEKIYAEIDRRGSEKEPAGDRQALGHPDQCGCQAGDGDRR